MPLQMPFAVCRRLPKTQAESRVPRIFAALTLHSRHPAGVRVILLSKDSPKEKYRQSCLLPEQKQPSLGIVTLAEYLSGCSSTLREAVGREIMSTQNAIRTGNQFMSANGQEREQTLPEQATRKRIDALGSVESTSPAHIPHHGSCCCMLCWPKNIKAYL